jgi:inner membrane protease subunit 1
MYPTLSLQGDYILQSRLLHRLRPLSRGDLVTAISPLDPSHQVLKRVIGLAGDSIIIDPSGERQRQLEIGGGYVAGPKLWGNGTPGETLVVPQGTVWLAGDNVSNSTDSRDYGPLPLGLIRGRVVGRVSCALCGELMCC